MAYDSGLAERVREALAELPVDEKRMFGGIAFLLDGNMVCGLLNEDLIVRVGPVVYDESLRLPHTRVFDLTGRVMRGWVTVGPDGYESDRDLRAWVARGLNFARSLPPK